MPQLVFSFILSLFFSGPAGAQTHSFADYYLINVESLLIDVPNSSGDEKIDLSISLQGENGVSVPLRSLSLGRVPTNYLVEALNDESIKIFSNDLVAALHRGGLLAEFIRQPQLLFQLKRYRTFRDKTHISFTVPLAKIHLSPNKSQTLAVSSANDSDFLSLQLTPFFY